MMLVNNALYLGGIPGPLTVETLHKNEQIIIHC